MKRVIVTGGNGFIGRHLVKKLLSYKTCALILIANTSDIHGNFLAETKSSGKIPLTFYTADIRDKKAISDIFQDERADTCIHLAAKISVSDSIKNPIETMDINVRGTLNVLEACYKSQVDKFVFTSSAAVYGDVKKLPISENQALEPLSPYGTSKMLAEQHISSYNKLNKIKNAISLRIFNVYGQDQRGQLDVISRFAERLSKGLPPIIHGDGIQTRDFISVDDVVDGIILSIKAMEETENNKNIIQLPSVLNLGTGTPTSIKELAQKMIEIFGYDLQPIFEKEKEEAGAIMHSYADMTKSKEHLNFVAKKGIETGLKEIIGPMLKGK